MGAYWDVLDGFYSGATSTAQYGTTNTSSSSYDGVEEVSSYTLNKEFTVERSLLTVNTDQSDKTVSIISKNLKNIEIKKLTKLIKNFKKTFNKVS